LSAWAKSYAFAGGRKKKEIKMNEYDVRRLALVLAIQAEIE